MLLRRGPKPTKFTSSATKQLGHIILGLNRDVVGVQDAIVNRRNLLMTTGTGLAAIAAAADPSAATTTTRSKARSDMH